LKQPAFLLLFLITYTSRETVALNIDGLNQCWLLEGNSRSRRPSDTLGSTVQPKGRRGCCKDSKECKRSNLHGDCCYCCSEWGFQCRVNDRVSKQAAVYCSSILVLVGDVFDNDDDDGLGRVSSDTPVVVSILIVKQPTVFQSKK
jgi:hypothetical protein